MYAAALWIVKQWRIVYIIILHWSKESIWPLNMQLLLHYQIPHIQAYQLHYLQVFDLGDTAMTYSYIIISIQLGSPLIYA